jgi:hypothetical protein
MTVDIMNCDINNDYFHFTNRKNIDSILNNGLIPSVGAASRLVGDRPNVSVSKGGKGIMGIINAFVHKFSNGLRISEIPEEYRKYFIEISDFESDMTISKEIATKAMIRKLKDEVYFRVRLESEQIEKAKIGVFSQYDVNLPMRIDKEKLDIVTDFDDKVLTAYDVAKYVYEKAKNKDIFREMHKHFFEMFEMKEQSSER